MSSSSDLRLLDIVIDNIVKGDVESLKTNLPVAMEQHETEWKTYSDGRQYKSRCWDHAVLADSTEVFAYLLENAAALSPKRLGTLINAAQSVKMVRYLVSIGGVIPKDACHHADNSSILNILVYLGADPLWVDHFGQTALMSAVISGCTDVFNTLLALEIFDLEAGTNGEKATVLHVALVCGNVKYVKALLRAGAVIGDVGYDVLYKIMRGRTVIHHSHAQCFEAIIEGSIDKKAKENLMKLCVVDFSDNDNKAWRKNLQKLLDKILGFL